MSLHPIKTEEDYDEALAEISELMSAGPGTAAGDRLDILTTLVEAYEQLHHPMLPPDPVDALLYYIESRGLTRRDLQPYIGNAARVSDVLNGALIGYGVARLELAQRHGLIFWPLISRDAAEPPARAIPPTSRFAVAPYFENRIGGMLLRTSF